MLGEHGSTVAQTARGLTVWPQPAGTRSGTPAIGASPQSADTRAPWPSRQLRIRVENRKARCVPRAIPAASAIGARMAKHPLHLAFYRICGKRIARAP